MSPREPDKPRRRPWLRRLCRWLEHGFAALGVLFVVYHVGFDLSVIVSASMRPTLNGTSAANGDWVLTEHVSYWFRKPRRWEVVTFRNTEGFRVMKRVVGLPGETVALRDGRIEIDGEPVERPASIRDIEYLPYGRLKRSRQAPCGTGYFVLGDDSRDSWDSRFEGPVPAERILGRALAVVWPAEDARFVNPSGVE